MAFGGVFNRPLFNDNINDTLVHIAKEQGNSNAWKQNPGPSYGVTPSWSGGTNYWSSAAGSSTGSIGGGQNWTPSYAAPVEPISVWIPDASSIMATAPMAAAPAPTFSSSIPSSAFQTSFGQNNRPLYKNENSWDQTESGLPSQSEIEPGRTEHGFTGVVNDVLRGLGFDVDASGKVDEGRMAWGDAQGDDVSPKAPVTIGDTPEDFLGLLLGDPDTMRKYEQKPVLSLASPEPLLSGEKNLGQWLWEDVGGVTMGNKEAMEEHNATASPLELLPFEFSDAPIGSPEWLDFTIFGPDNQRNFVDDLSQAALTAAGAIADLRNIWSGNADDEFGTDINGRYYSSEDLEKIKDNGWLRNDVVDNPDDADIFAYYFNPDTGQSWSWSDWQGANTSGYRYATEAEAMAGIYDALDADGYALIAIDGVELASGEIVPWSTFDNLQYKEVAKDAATEEDKRLGTPMVVYYQDNDGNEISYKDLFSTFGTDVYDQQNATIDLPIIGEVSGLNKINPKSPLEDWRDILPWTTDVALQSAPYFIPVFRELVTAARIGAALEGYNPNTFDYKTGTFSDEPISNAQQAALVTQPIVDYLSERLGGFVPSSMKTPEKEMAKAAKNATRSWLNKTVRAGLAEGAEEILAAPFEMIGNVYDINDTLRNQEYDEYGNVYYDPNTSYTDQFNNLMSNLGENFIGGALLGAPVAGAQMAPRHLRLTSQKIANRGKDYADLRRLDTDPTENPPMFAGMFNKDVGNVKYGSSLVDEREDEENR